MYDLINMTFDLYHQLLPNKYSYNYDYEVFSQFEYTQSIKLYDYSFFFKQANKFINIFYLHSTFENGLILLPYLGG